MHCIGAEKQQDCGQKCRNELTVISGVEGFQFQEQESQPILDLLGFYMKKKNKNSRRDL
jgi:hypothetical protein